MGTMNLDTTNAVCDCGHWREEHHDGLCDGCAGYPLHAHAFTPNDSYTREALAELDASAERYTKRLRTAVILAHEVYQGPGAVLGDDLVVENFDDEESFVESVDGGYWIEARVWISADDVEDRMREKP